MTMMDERVAERRRGVSEDRARRRLRWVLGTIAAVLVAVGAIWLIRSPVLSIASVTVTGNTMSNPAAYVDELGMGIGVPTIDVRAGAIEEAIEADPWVADAVVAVSWPGSMSIDVTEQVPLAIVEAPSGWYLAAIDGSIIATSEERDDLPRVGIVAEGVAVGEAASDEMTLGALAFVNALPEDRRADAVLFVRDEGLFVVMDGHEVRLGRPNQLEAKAVVLVELLASGLEEGAAIDLIAPMRPAVRNPQPEVETEE
ncbi:MAG: cell division protein FtsQ/DivIB [Acidimicrobiia bacterium]